MRPAVLSYSGSYVYVTFCMLCVITASSATQSRYLSIFFFVVVVLHVSVSRSQSCLGCRFDACLSVLLLSSACLALSCSALVHHYPVLHRLFLHFQRPFNHFNHRLTFTLSFNASFFSSHCFAIKWIYLPSQHLCYKY